MSEPLVSIIVRTKDRPQLLMRALSSIFAQTYRPIEVVLVNDGGPELDIVEIKKVLGDVFLNYLRLEKNTGRAHAGNVGIENAKGEYVGFLDDDDVYFPEGVDTLVTAALCARNNVLYGKVVCRKYADDDLLKVIEEREVGEPFDAGRLVLENFIPINAVCVPINLLRKIGLLDTALPIFEDWDMMIRLSEAATFQFVDAVVAEYSVIGSATITGKGGVETQNTYREKVLAKHLAKVKAYDFLSYLQSIVDRVVREKDEKIHRALCEKDEKIHELAQFLDEKESIIKTLEASALIQEEGITWLRGVVASKDEELARSVLREEELKKLLEEVFASDSWKLTKPLRDAGKASRKFISRLKHGK
jgi:hypothetical protein